MVTFLFLLISLPSMNSSKQNDGFFQEFETDISNISLPKKFTYPFYYEPHPLCVIASNELQNYLETQTAWQHNFGLSIIDNSPVIGKMFGVLVVQNKQKEIGYLAAVSGKLANTNSHTKFVPPIFDMLQKNSFFHKEEEKVNQLNAEIETLENNPKYISLKALLKAEKIKYNKILTKEKEKLNQEKKNRSQIRKSAILTLNSEAYNQLVEKLKKESFHHYFFFKEFSEYCENKLNNIKKQITYFTQQINSLKELRKKTSTNLQKQLFDQYQFLNQLGNIKTLSEVFETAAIHNPPAGAGECAAPKLLQYAFSHDLKPITMAEFWWGQSPNEEIRKHKYFYPACQGKCKPILNHMLEGVEMDTNPMLTNPAIGKEIAIIFEDNDLAIINKPAEFLSVPGIHIQDSVFTRMKQRYPKATGPIIVHRLDMSTSGLMIIAKNKKANKNLQNQFINRTVKKRYTALLDGYLPQQKGTIELPLRVDLNDRPRQLVCFEHGKPALTFWETIIEKNNKTLVHFYPKTGRTHQLRVHASHTKGLNTAIVGDDLYGKKADRLYLHADLLEFEHPTTKKRLTFQLDAPFCKK